MPAGKRSGSTERARRGSSDTPSRPPSPHLENPAAGRCRNTRPGADSAFDLIGSARGPETFDFDPGGRQPSADEPEVLHSLLVAAMAVVGLRRYSLPARPRRSREGHVELANGDIVEVVREGHRRHPPRGPAPARRRTVDPDQDPGRSRVAEARGSPATCRKDKDERGERKQQEQPTLNLRSRSWASSRRSSRIVSNGSARRDRLDPAFRKQDGPPTASKPTRVETSAPGKGLRRWPALPHDRLRGSQLHHREVPGPDLSCCDLPGRRHPVWIRWEILAAINEIETDYGRNLSVSSAQAVAGCSSCPRL